MSHPTYTSLSDLVRRAGLVLMPAELHGLVTGLLVADTSLPEDAFLKLVLEESEPGDVLASENAEQLRLLYQATREALQSPTLDFVPLLPDDDEPLVDRVDAACDWARGLLYGLTEQGVDRRKGLAEDVSGFIEDLGEISKGGYTVDETEDGEMIYADLLEYLRMGTLMVQEELQPIQSTPEAEVH